MDGMITIYSDIVSNKKLARIDGEVIEVPYWIVGKYGYSVPIDILR